MNNKNIIIIFAYFIPTVAFAQRSLANVIFDLTLTLVGIVPFLVGLALVFFIIGVLKYIMSQDDESGRTAARYMMVNGIIALFVIVSVWGLVSVVSSTVGVGQGGGIPTPPVPRGF